MNTRMMARQRSTLALLTALLLSLLFTQVASAQAATQPAAANVNVYLPLITGSVGDPNPGPSLPEKFVGTWFTGNAPLNDFYNPTTGEWRDVNGIGQMYKFASNGDYTYTAFARFQTGACRSEVSVYKQGGVSISGNSLTLTTNASKTRTVTVCPTPHESITEGSQAPVTVEWTLGPNDSGIIKLITTAAGSEGPVETEFSKIGMAESLVGLWYEGDLSEEGFYDPATKTFDLNSGEGSWYEFAANATYQHGEHGFSAPNAQGCVLEGWVYETGVIEVIGGALTIKPQSGILRLVNSCDGTPTVTDPWVADPNNFAWKHLDPHGDIKLVLIQLMPFAEYTFHR